MKGARWTESTAVDPEHSNVDPEEEAARNRNTLLSYFNDIASIPTLTKEEEVMLAKEMEAATHRDAQRDPLRVVHVARGDRHLARAAGREARDREDVGVLRLRHAGGRGARRDARQVL